MSDLRKNCNQGQQKQTLRVSSPPASRSSENPGLFRVNDDYTPRPRTALLMCQEKYSAIGISAIGNY